MKELNITCLDASTLSRGDIDFTPLEALGNFSHFDRTDPSQVIERAQGADVILTNKVVLDAGIIQSLPNLRLILVCATGVNVVDLDTATAHKIPVCNVAGYSTPSVAQHTAALLLSLVTKVHRLANEHEKWPQSPIFTRLTHPITELAGRSCGIVGLGEIGSAFAGIAEALEMKVQVLAREGSLNSYRPDLPRLSAEQFFETSDVVSLHCPLTSENEHMINRATLSSMKPGSLLLNVSRGPLVNEVDLAEALRTGHLSGAGLDVLSAEPPPPDHPLFAHDLADLNLIMTPHTAWLSLESRRRLLEGVVDNLKNWIAGSPSNRVA